MDDAEIKKAQNFDLIGARVFIDGLVRYGWTYPELSCCQGQVLKGLFTHIDRSELAKGNIKLKGEDNGKLWNPLGPKFLSLTWPRPSISI